MKRCHTVWMCLHLIPASGCGWLSGLYDPIPGYVAPPEDDMPVMPTPDMGPDIIAPASVTATGNTDNIMVSWSPVDGAVGYEIQIDGEGTWHHTDKTSYTDSQAPGATIASATTQASQATARPHVALEASIQTEPGKERTYRVRAVFPKNMRSDASQEARASRTPTTLEYAWQINTDGLGTWKTIEGANEATHHDTTAPGNGDPVAYRCQVRFVGEDSWSDCDEGEGWRLAVKDVKAGLGSTCVLMNNNQLKCWGLSGLNDDKEPIIQSTPILIMLPTDKQLEKIGRLETTTKHEEELWGVSPDQFKICAITRSKTLECWTFGRSIDPSSPQHNLQKLPKYENIKDGILQYEQGLGHTCVTYETAKPHCWGDNAQGQLGLGDTNNRSQPSEQVSVNALQISSGLFHTCAIELGDLVYCWGLNHENVLGKDTPDRIQPHPLQVLYQDGREVHAFAGGTCIVTQRGTLKCWGDNYRGQLGYGDYTSRHDAKNVTEIELADRCKQFAAGKLTPTNCAIIENGGVQCWGENLAGEAGPSKQGDVTKPSPVLNLAQPAIKVAMGAGHACAILQDGSLRCWGDNSAGQLGLGDRRNRGLQESDFPLPEVNVW